MGDEVFPARPGSLRVVAQADGSLMLFALDERDGRLRVCQPYSLDILAFGHWSNLYGKATSAEIRLGAALGWGNLLYLFEFEKPTPTSIERVWHRRPVQVNSADILDSGLFEDAEALQHIVGVPNADGHLEFWGVGYQEDEQQPPGYVLHKWQDGADSWVGWRAFEPPSDDPRARMRYDRNFVLPTAPNPDSLIDIFMGAS